MPPDVCEKQCMMEQRIEALEKDSERNQITHKEFFSRFEDMKERMARTDERYMQIKADTSEIKNSVREANEAIQALNEKPGKRWEGIVDKVLWLVIGGMIAFFLSQIGLNV